MLVNIRSLFAFPPMKHFSNTLSFLLSSILVMLFMTVCIVTYGRLQQFNPLFSQYLSTLTHQPIQIQGIITPRFSPKPGVHFPHIYIGTPNGAYSAKLDHVVLQPNIAQLLKGKLFFNKLKIKALHLNITPSAFNATLPLTSSSATPPSLPMFQLNRILIKSGDILIHTPSKRIQLSNLQFSAHPFNWDNHPFDSTLNGTININDNIHPPFTATVAFQGLIRLSTDLLKQTQSYLLAIAPNGKFTVTDLSWGALSLQTISTTIQTQANTLLFNPLIFQFAQGDTTGDATLDAKSGVLFFTQRASDIDSQAFLAPFFLQPPINGHVSFAIHHQLHLFHSTPLDSLNGTGFIIFKNGMIHHFNLERILKYAAEKLRAAVNLPATALETSPPPPITHAMISDGDTPFQRVSLQYNVLGNTILQGKLNFQNDLLALNGTGFYYLKNTTINAAFRATSKISDPTVNQIQTLLGGDFPLIIQGPLTNLAIAPDTQKIAPYLNSIVLQRLLNMPTDQIQKQLHFLFQLPILPNAPS